MNPVFHGPTIYDGRRDRDGDEVPDAPDTGLLDWELRHVVSTFFIDRDPEGLGRGAVVPVNDLSCKFI